MCIYKCSNVQCIYMAEVHNVIRCHPLCKKYSDGMNCVKRQVKRKKRN